MKKQKAQKHKSFSEKAINLYLRKIKKWMFCPACQQSKMTIKKSSAYWECEECGYKLLADEFEDGYVFWFCDECDTYLNNQEGFSRKASRHICKECGYENDISANNIKGICSDCGKIIPDADGTLCDECKQIRKERAKEWLKKAGTVVGIGVAVVAAACLTPESTEQNQGYSYLSDGDDDESNSTFRCANCGNSDESSLWDEGDTVYCSVCHHRTYTSTREDAVTECPYCHRLRDVKAMYCRWCNDATWQAITRTEFKEVDEILKEMGC